jgi:hypothetical protein
MTTELTYLAWAGILTALIRIPWMLNKVAVRGLAVVSRYPKESAPLSGWAHRLWVAHEDSVDNLVVFATLIVVPGSRRLPMWPDLPRFWSSPGKC